MAKQALGTMSGAQTPTDEGCLRNFALFFLFAFLDERLAIEVADRAVAQFKSKAKKFSPGSSEESKALIAICFEQWKANKKRIARGQPSSSLKDFGQLPQGFDETAWMRFQKDAAEEELIAVLFLRILRLEPQDICEALKISSGTLRHRVGRGVRMLGDYVGPSI